MRSLVWFTIGFSTACAVSLWLLPQAYVFLCIAVFAVLGVCISVRNPGHVRRILTLIILGVVAGMSWFSCFQRFYLNAIADLNGEQKNLTITAMDYSEKTVYGTTRVNGSTVWNGKRYKICAYLDESVSLNPGDTITAPFQLEDTITGELYYPGNGIFLVGYQKDKGSIDREETQKSLVQMTSVLAKKLESRIVHYFTQSEFVFAKALLLGQTEGIDYAMDTQLKVSGIRHIVAVSGLHVSMLLGLLHVLTWKRRWLTACIGIPVLAVFAAMAGYTPSVCRACLMSALMVLGLCIDREYDGETALAFSVLVLLLINPMAVASVSLQLSAASVAGIFLFYEPICETLMEKWKTESNWMKRVRQWVTSSISITLSAMFFTTPLSAVHFGMVSLIGIVTNLMTLWAVSIIFCGIIAVCALSFLWHSGAVILAELVSGLIQYVLQCAEGLSRFPVAAVYTDSIYIVVWLAFCYCLIGLFLLQQKRSDVKLVMCVVLALTVSLFFSWMEPAGSSVRMMVLDVGQGQSIVLQTEGRTFLVDCGGDSDEGTADIIAQTLLSQGIFRLDGILITHYDRDHAGALPHLLTRLKTDYLITPFAQEAPVMPAFDGQAIQVQKDMIVPLESGSVQIFPSGYWGDGNENSLCILFETENCAILITGDRSSLGEKLLLRKTKLPKVDALIAGHHGAEDSTSRELLDAVQPEIVMISVGKDNYYGHPHENTLRRLEEYGCKVYRTDRNGTLEFRR